MTFAIATTISLLLAIPLVLLGTLVMLRGAGWLGWWQLPVILGFGCGWPLALAWLRRARETRAAAGRPGLPVLDIFGGPGPLTPTMGFWAVAAMLALMVCGIGCGVVIERLGGHPVTILVVFGSCGVLAFVAALRLQGPTLDESGQGVSPRGVHPIVGALGWAGTLGRGGYALRLLYWQAVQVACEVWLLRPRDPISSIGSAHPRVVMLGCVMLAAGWFRTAAGVRRSRDIDRNETGAVFVVLAWLMELAGRSTLVWQSLFVQVALLILPRSSFRREVR